MHSSFEHESLMTHSFSSAPEGAFPPEVVTLNSTSVRVLWAAPLVPNGAITHYSIYLDGQLYISTDNTSGSVELGGLQPFTVYDVQVSIILVIQNHKATQMSGETSTHSDQAIADVSCCVSWAWRGCLGGGMHSVCMCEGQQHKVNNRGGHAS